MRLAALATGVFLALTSLAAAQTYDTPKALLEAFYQPYLTGEFADDDTPFRSERLNGLYEEDAKRTPDGELGALDFDPYIDGQDFEITKLEIGEPAISGDTATVDVSFDNFEKPTKLTYDLVKENGGWRIDDVVSEDPEYPYRLSEIFTTAGTGPDDGSTEDGAAAD